MTLESRHGPRSGPDFRGSTSPERSQIDGRVARTPALDEALDRRMQDDVVEVVEAEQPVTADGGVLGVDCLQRATAEVTGEDDVHDVLGREALNGRDRVDDRHRTLDCHLLADPELLPELAVQGIDQALPRVHSSTRQQPVLLPGFLVAAQQHTFVPAQQRRDPDPRLSAHASTRARGPEAANAPLALRQLLGLDQLELRDLQDDELGDPHSGLDDESLRPVGVEQDNADLTAVAGIDQPWRVDDGDPVPGGKPGAWLDESGVSVRNRDRQTGANNGPLPGPELHALAGGQVEARVTRIGAGGDDRVFAETLDLQLDHLTERVGSSRASASR